MNDALLDAIVAAPDDDAPRLVWADRNGGERGELVVLQCALAAHAASPDDRPRLATRAGQLVGEHSSTWTRLGAIARPTFVRGFVEEITIAMDKLEAHVGTIWREEPLVRALVVTDIAAYATHSSEAQNAWTIAAFTLANVFAEVPPGRVRALTLSPFAEATGVWESLYFRRDAFGRALVRVVAESPPLASVTELVIPGVPEAQALFDRFRAER